MRRLALFTPSMSSGIARCSVRHVSLFECSLILAAQSTPMMLYVLEVVVQKRGENRRLERLIPFCLCAQPLQWSPWNCTASAIVLRGGQGLQPMIP